jgi:rubrerythrin
VGEDRHTVQAILSAYIEYLMEQLVVHREVLVTDFGVIRALLARHKAVNTGTHTVAARVRILASKKLRKRLKTEDAMEKYAVDETTNNERMDKLATPKGYCPVCGQEVRVHGTVRVCPKCGTEPFEENR